MLIDFYILVYRE